MIKKETIEALIANGLSEREHLFLIDLSIATDNSIKVVIDGDAGVSVEDCIFISRAIEHNLDREEQDFSLEVTSAGVSAALTLPRQFKKNIGRTLAVRANPDINIKAELVEVDDHGITITWSAKEPKPLGKGKVTVNKQAKIEFKDILEAKVIIKF